MRINAKLKKVKTNWIQETLKRWPDFFQVSFSLFENTMYRAWELSDLVHFSRFKSRTRCFSWNVHVKCRVMILIRFCGFVLQGFKDRFSRQLSKNHKSHHGHFRSHSSRKHRRMSSWREIQLTFVKQQYHYRTEHFLWSKSSKKFRRGSFASTSLLWQRD